MRTSRHILRSSVRCIILALSSLIAKAQVTEISTPLIPAPVSADNLLNDVLAQLPTNTVTIKGRLRSFRKSSRPQNKGANGLQGSTYRVDMVLNWGADQPSADYIIRTKKGKAVEAMRIVRSPTGSPTATYREGPDLTPADPPPMTDRIQTTNVSWSDLSLSFLWWRGGSIVARDMVRGRSCIVVDVPAPANVKDDYHLVKLWIDDTYHVLMQAEGYDQHQKLKRRMAVKSLKKFGDQWMIKDLQIENLPSRFRTMLSIDSLETTSAQSSDPKPKETPPRGP